MKIDTLEDYKPHLKRIEDAKGYLFALKESAPSLLVFGDVDSLSEIDSPSNVISAIKADISSSASLLESIIITLDEENHPLKDMILEKDGRKSIKIGRFGLEKEGNSYYLSLGSGMQRTSRPEIVKVAREIISKEATGIWYGDMKNEIFASIDENLKDITYAMDRAYDRNNKYEYARLYEQREKISALASFTLEKLKKEISLVEADVVAQEVMNEMSSKGNARANDIKKDSLVILKDDNGKSYIAQNPKQIIVDNELIGLFERNKSMDSMELDGATDIDKLKRLMQEIDGREIATKEAYGFASRLLGRHNALGIYFKEGKKLDGSVAQVNKVIVDLRYPASFIHELTHHIDLSGNIDNRDALVSRLDSYNSYEGIDKVNYYSNDAELIARAGEVSHTLYQSKFGEILELVRAQSKSDEKEISRLRGILGVSYGVHENNFLDVLRQNSYTNGLSKELGYYIENGNIYFDVKNRSFEELAHVYSTFQDLLNYEHKIDYSVDNVFLGELSRESQKERKSFVRKEGLEKYTQDDFYSVAAGIRQGRVVNITLDELIDDYAALERAKQGVRLSWVMSEIGDRELRLKHGFMAIDTYKEIYDRNIEVKGYCAHPTIVKNAIVSDEERDYFVALLKNGKERSSVIGGTFDNESRLRIAGEMEPKQLADILNNSSSANVKVLAKDWFFRSMLPYYKEKEPELYRKAHEVFKLIDAAKFESVASSLFLAYIRDDNKSSYDYGFKLMGIDSLNKVGSGSIENAKLLNEWYAKADDFFDRNCEVVFKQELLKFAKNSGIVIEPRHREDALAISTLSNLRKNIYSKKEFSDMLKESDPLRLQEVLGKYSEDLSEKYDAEYFKEHAYDSYSINRRNIAMFRLGESFNEAVTSLITSSEKKIKSSSSKKELDSAIASSEPETAIEDKSTLNKYQAASNLLEKDVLTFDDVSILIQRELLEDEIAEFIKNNKSPRDVISMYKNKMAGFEAAINGDKKADIEDNFYSLLKSAEIKDFTRTDTGEVIKIFTLGPKLSKDEFKEFSSEVKKNGIGYYSNIAKGFIINDGMMGYFGGKENLSDERLNNNKSDFCTLVHKEDINKIFDKKNGRVEALNKSSKSVLELFKFMDKNIESIKFDTRDELNKFILLQKKGDSDGYIGVLVKNGLPESTLSLPTIEDYKIIFEKSFQDYTKERLGELKEKYSEILSLKSDLENKKITPSKVIGAGYLNPARSAREWVDKQIAFAKENLDRGFSHTTLANYVFLHNKYRGIAPVEKLSDLIMIEQKYQDVLIGVDFENLNKSIAFLKGQGFKAEAQSSINKEVQIDSSSKHEKILITIDNPLEYEFDGAIQFDLSTLGDSNEAIEVKKIDINSILARLKEIEKEFINIHSDKLIELKRDFNEFSSDLFAVSDETKILEFDERIELFSAGVGSAEISADERNTLDGLADRADLCQAVCEK